MKSLENYIDEYSVSHQHPTNKLIHKLYVPAIILGILGISKAMPVPVSWPLWFDWSTILVIFSLVFYSFFKNIRLMIAVLIFIIPLIILLEILRPRFFILSVVVFIVAWIGQFIGHNIEGKKPSFLDDLFFLLIGPIWTINSLAAQMGVDLKINNAKDTY